VFELGGTMTSTSSRCVDTSTVASSASDAMVAHQCRYRGTSPTQCAFTELAAGRTVYVARWIANSKMIGVNEPLVNRMRA
jgi:hypothetical protein